MPLTPEQRQMLRQRRDEVRHELDTLSASPAPAESQNPTDRYQELQDELEKIELDLGEADPDQ